MKKIPIDKICNYYEFEWLGGTHPFFYAENLDEAISLALKSKHGKNQDVNSIRRVRIISIPFKVKGKSNWTQSQWHKERKKHRT